MGRHFADCQLNSVRMGDMIRRFLCWTQSLWIFTNQTWPLLMLNIFLERSMMSDGNSELTEVTPVTNFTLLFSARLVATKIGKSFMMFLISEYDFYGK